MVSSLQNRQTNKYDIKCCQEPSNNLNLNSDLSTTSGHSRKSPPSGETRSPGGSAAFRTPRTWGGPTSTHRLGIQQRDLAREQADEAEGPHQAQMQQPFAF